MTEVRGAFIMGLGVASVTVAVALGSAALRESALMAVRPSPAPRAPLARPSSWPAPW